MTYTTYSVFDFDAQQPLAYARHKPMTVRMNDVGLNLALVLHQAVENVDGFTDAALDEVRK